MRSKYGMTRVADVWSPTHKKDNANANTVLQFLKSIRLNCSRLVQILKRFKTFKCFDSLCDLFYTMYRTVAHKDFFSQNTKRRLVYLRLRIICSDFIIFAIQKFRPVLLEISGKLRISSHWTKIINYNYNANNSCLNNILPRCIVLSGFIPFSMKFTPKGSRKIKV